MMEKGVIGKNCIDFTVLQIYSQGPNCLQLLISYFSKLDQFYNFDFKKEFLFRKAVKYRILFTSSTILICNTSIMGLKGTNCV